MTARDTARLIATERERSLFGRCGFCGGRCRGSVCEGHRDLPQLEFSANHDPAPTRANEEGPGRNYSKEATS